MMDDDDDDEPSWARRTANARAPNLRSQLNSIADQWERTKLTEQSTLNRRINSLVAQNRTTETELEKLKEKLSETESKLEEKGKELTLANEKIKNLESGHGNASKKLLGMQFLVAELLNNWPELPVYAEVPPPIEEDDDDSDDSDESDEESVSDEGESDSDMSDDDILNEQENSLSENNTSPNSSSSKKKKRGKRGGKKKRKTIGNGNEDGDDDSGASSNNASPVLSSLAASSADNPPPIPPLDGGVVDQLNSLELSNSGSKKKNKKNKKSKKGKKSLNQSDDSFNMVKSMNKKKKKKPSTTFLMPQITHYEKAPLPVGLPIPNSLLTRNDFYELVGGEGLTRKQLNRLESLFENSSDNDDYEMELMVDECLGGGLNACCGASGSLRIAKLLLSQGANVSYMGQQFEASPIHRAVQFGHDNLVSLLLGHKVNINSTDQNLGRTALHYAAEYNRPTLAKLLIQKGAMVDAVDNNGETATAIADRLKWKKVAAILSDPSVLFWNFANRANKLYKATEFELAIKVYEKAFSILENVRPIPSEQNRATLHYNCARAASNLGQQVKALAQCNAALQLVPGYNSAIEQRAKCHLAIYNFKLSVDDLNTLITGASSTDVSNGSLDNWVKLKRDAENRLNETHFDTLGLKERGKMSTAAEIKKGYRNQCISWHPDKHVNSEEAKHRAHIMFQRVNEAHEVLSDPVKRRNYEYTMRFSRTSSASSASSASSPFGRGFSSKWSYEDSEDEDEDGHL